MEPKKLPVPVVNGMQLPLQLFVSMSVLHSQQPLPALLPLSALSRLLTHAPTKPTSKLLALIRIKLVVVLPQISVTPPLTLVPALLLTLIALLRLIKLLAI